MWRAVIDASGKVVSEGTEVADSLPEGWVAMPVDGPSAGRPWDAELCAWGVKPSPAEAPASVDTELVDAARAKISAASSIDGVREALTAVLDIVAS